MRFYSKCSWIAAVVIVSTALFFSGEAAGQQPRFKVLAFYSARTEPDHVLFSDGALKFFAEIAAKDNFAFTSTTNWDGLNEANLAKYQLVVWLNDEPTKPEQRRAFQNYMEHGGAWLGFHVSAYNDKETNWPWFVDFLGGSVFQGNSWPPLAAKLTVDDRAHPVAMGIPESFMAPDNEWYIWKPSPQLNKDVKVLVTLDPSNYPIGFKDVLQSGDLPVVWTNTRYKMLYMNLGHGDKIFTSAIQNKLIENAALWLGAGAVSPVSGAAAGTLISPNAVVVNPKTSKAYAVDSSGNTVTVMNGVTGKSATIGVGLEPMAIAVNPVTNKIYVGNTGSGTVSVIDGATDAVTATVKVGALPYVIAVNPVTNRIYVSKTFSNTMTVIDGATNATSNLKAGIQADAMAVNAATNKMYLTNYEGQNVTVLDGASHERATVATGVHAWAVAVNSATNKIYVANAGSNQLAVIDGANHSVTNVNVGKTPCTVAVDASANRVYVVNYGSDSVSAVDGEKNEVIATVNVGSRPQGIAVNAATHAIYVANTHDNDVTVIEGVNNSVIATIPAGENPYAIAVDEKANRAYVSSMGKDKLTVIDGRGTVGAPH
jgi:YVTN family beta-propeller protein